MMRFCMIASLAAMLVACGAPAPEAPAVPQTATDRPSEAPPPVDPELLSAPNDAFTAVEPSEFQVFGAPTVAEAVQPVLAGVDVALSIREASDSAIVDVVLGNMEDDALAAQHSRFEFRREPDGWYPTNAYRRQQCRRGELAGQWSASPCP